MLLGGLWHGAGWTFILWGACHGVFLIVNHLSCHFKLQIPDSLSRILTLLAVICGWVIFRSPDVPQAINILSGMIGLNGIVLPESYLGYLGFLKNMGVSFDYLTKSNFNKTDLALLGILFLCVIKMPNSNSLWKIFMKRPIITGVFSALFFLFYLINLQKSAEFIYYNF